MDCRFLISVLLLHALLDVSAASLYIRCFQKTVRRSVDNARPMTELFYVTPYQCMDQCIVATNNHAPKARLCRSFVYDHLQHSCRLYEHDGNEPPAIIHPANGYDYYRRTAVLNQCAGPGSPTEDYSLSSEVASNPNFYQMKKPQKKVKENFYENIQATAVNSNGQNGIDSAISGGQLNDKTENVASHGQPSSSEELYSKHSKSAQPHPASRPNARPTTAAPVEYVTRIANEVEIFDPIPTSPPRPKKVRPSAGLPAGSDQVVHLPNSAAELGYETPKKPKKHRTTTPAPVEPELPPEPATFRPTTHRPAPAVHHTTPRPTTHRTTHRPPPPPPPPATSPPKAVTHPQSEPDCRTSTAYYVVIGNEIILPISGAENDVKVIQGIEQAECAKHCSSNKGPRGEHIKCSSINYFPVTQKCEMYSILAEPHGPGNLVENDDVIYSEKFCLPPSQADCHDDEIFLLQVQKKITGRQLSVASASSITNCLRSCLNARGCSAASYDSNRNRCTLHSVDIGENPEAVQDAEAGWVLIENGCSGKRRKPSSVLQGVTQHSVDEDVQGDTQWSSWSDCQFKVRGELVRVRTRQCEADCPDGGMQLEKCY